MSIKTVKNGIRRGDIIEREGRNLILRREDGDCFFNQDYPQRENNPIFYTDITSDFKSGDFVTTVFNPDCYGLVLFQKEDYCDVLWEFKRDRAYPNRLTHIADLRSVSAEDVSRKEREMLSRGDIELKEGDLVIKKKDAPSLSIETPIGHIQTISGGQFVISWIDVVTEDLSESKESFCYPFELMRVSLLEYHKVLNSSVPINYHISVAIGRREPLSSGHSDVSSTIATSSQFIDDRDVLQEEIRFVSLRAERLEEVLQGVFKKLEAFEEREKKAQSIEEALEEAMRKIELLEKTGDELERTRVTNEELLPVLASMQKQLTKRQFVFQVATRMVGSLGATFVRQLLQSMGINVDFLLKMLGL